MAEHKTEKIIDELCCGFKIKPPKDEDSLAKSEYLKILSWIASTIMILCLFLLITERIGIIESLLILLTSIPISWVVLCFITQIGHNSISLVYGGGRANWSLREQLHGDLLRVKYLNRNNNFAEALALLNTIIERKPDHKEALFIKAQILWKSFRNYGGAKMCLKTIIDIESSEDEHINRWAATLSDEITAQSKKYSN